MEYMNVKEAAQQWNISNRLVRKLCSEGKIEGVIKMGRAYMIPINNEKPITENILHGKEVSKEFHELFQRIDGKKEELNQKEPIIKDKLNQRHKQFMIEFIYNENALAGNSLTLEETARVLEGYTISDKMLKDHLEVVGLKEAFLYVDRAVKENIKLSEGMIKEIHSHLLIDQYEERGVYRKMPVRTLGAYLEPPPTYLISVQMEELITRHLKEQKKHHIIESAVRFHLDFEAIQPFSEGNGRTGLLLLNYELMKHNYPPINIKYSDMYQYYESFDEYQKDENAEPMIRMIAGYVEEEIDSRLSL